ncbi:MAG: hypothetical protein AAB262_02125 [Elusimicrobiota bacterium]
MIALLPMILLASPTRAETASAAVKRVMDRVEKSVAATQGKDAREIAGSDRSLEALGHELVPFSGKAVESLAACANDLKRPPKVRLFATVFLGILGDPAAEKPLTAILLDTEQDPSVRSAAAQGLGTLNLLPEPTRKSLCAVLALPDSPRDLLDNVLIPVSRLGCIDPAPLEHAARSYGPRPSGRDLETVRRAAAALGRSRGEAPARALLRLLTYFPSRSGARAAVIAALPGKALELTGGLAKEAWLPLREALLCETAETASMLVLIPLAAEFPLFGGAALLPLTSHPDAEVRAEAAQALAKLKYARARVSGTR